MVRFPNLTKTTLVQDINQAMEFEKEEDRLTPVLKMCISALS